MPCPLPEFNFFTALVPAIPPTVAALAGFYIFHRLATRRQTRDEIYKTAGLVAEMIDDTIGAAEVAWRANGAEAVQLGYVSKLRYQTTQLDLAVTHLKDRNATFSKLLRPLGDLKKHVDEFHKPKWPPENVADEKRPPQTGCSFHAYSAANLLKKDLFSVFAAQYR